MLCLLLLGGCYTHVPVQIERVSPPEQVRARLSSEGAERIAPLLGSPQSTIEGDLLAVEPEGLAMSVEAGRRQEGFHVESLRQELVVPRSDIVVLERRQLDPLRTAAAGAVIAGVAAFVILELADGSEDQRIPPPGTGPAEVRVPVFHWSVP